MLRVASLAWRWEVPWEIIADPSVTLRHPCGAAPKTGLTVIRPEQRCADRNLFTSYLSGSMGIAESLSCTSEWKTPWSRQSNNHVSELRLACNVYP
jgi:hypothetical protein